MTPVWRIPAIIALLVAGPAQALLPAAPTASPAAEASPQAIETAQGEDDDQRIAKRISGIFGELPSLGGVNVEVQQGVVTLSGKVPDSGAITRAENIAARVAGVVTVENSLERDTSIGTDGGAVSKVEQRLDELVKILPLAALALAVALVVSAIGYVLGGLTRVWEKLTPNSFLAELIGGAIKFIFVILGIVIALDMLGATTMLGAVLGGAGVIGIALGFAMRDTIENYVASLLLSLRQPFRANDWVLIDGQEGRVIRLTSRATVLMTLDGNQLRIPNSQVFTAVILNYTANPQRRFDFVLGIDAEDDPTAARHLGVETLSALPFVLADPPPTARVEEVGDSNIVLKFLGWIDQNETDWYKAKSRAIPAVKNALEEAGFALPEPIYRLRFDNGAGQVPSDQQAAQTAKPGKPKPSASVTVSEEAAQDVAPEKAISDLVDDERRSAAGSGDLLDASKPVE